VQITKPRTQRKKLFQAPAHVRYKHFAAPLSPDLKRKHGTNAVPVRSGDTVRVMRGDRKGFEGKITRVDRQKYRIFVEGVTREKVDGSSIQIPIHPSKVMITNLTLDDKWRSEALKRKGMPLEKEAPLPPVAEVAAEEEVEEKPEAKKVKKKPRRKKKKKEAPAKPAEEVKKTKKADKPKRRRTKKAKAEKGAE
jgi:large subunit ribosomal protein L24